MKKDILIVIILLLAACNNEGMVTTVRSDRTTLIKSSVWQAADSGRYYYDVRINGSLFIFLDDKSDTLIRIYDRDDVRTLQNYYVNPKRNILDNKLQFLKSNSRYEGGDDKIFIIQNAAIVALQPDSEQILSQPIAYPFTKLPNSTDFSITSEEIYAAPVNSGNAYSSFLIHNPLLGDVRAKVYQHENLTYPKTSTAYRTNLTVSEKQKTVVSALRYINDVQFYDLKGNIRKVVTFGNEHILPVIGGNEVDRAKSVKCFLYIYDTSRYVYCLYDGTPDYTALSKIIVLDWEGRHVRTYQADRCLKQIAVSADDAEIVALSTAEQYGQDVILYKIK